MAVSFLGPLKPQDFSKWEKEEIEILHTQICKNILKVNRATPNNSCRAELGQYPLLINTFTYLLRLIILQLYSCSMYYNRFVRKKIWTKQVKTCWA